MTRTTAVAGFVAMLVLLTVGALGIWRDEGGGLGLQLYCATSAIGLVMMLGILCLEWEWLK